MIRASDRDFHRAALAKTWGVADQVGLLGVLVKLLDGGMRQQLAHQVGYSPLAWDYGRFVNLVRLQPRLPRRPRVLVGEVRPP